MSGSQSSGIIWDYLNLGNIGQPNAINLQLGNCFFRTHKNGDVLQNNYGDSIIVLCSPVIPGVCTSTSSGDATSKHEILKSDFGSISIHISRYFEYIYICIIYALGLLIEAC